MGKIKNPMTVVQSDGDDGILHIADIKGEITLVSDVPYSTPVEIIHNLGAVPSGCIIFMTGLTGSDPLPRISTFASTWGWPILSEFYFYRESLSYYKSSDYSSERSGGMYGIFDVNDTSFKFRGDDSHYYLRAGTYKWGVIA